MSTDAMSVQKTMSDSLELDVQLCLLEWMLKTELKCSAGIAYILTHGAISPGPVSAFYRGF